MVLSRRMEPYVPHGGALGLLIFALIKAAMPFAGAIALVVAGLALAGRKYQGWKLLFVGSLSIFMCGLAITAFVPQVSSFSSLLKVDWSGAPGPAAVDHGPQVHHGGLLGYLVLWIVRNLMPFAALAALITLGAAMRGRRFKGWRVVLGASLGLWVAGFSIGQRFPRMSTFWPASLFGGVPAVAGPAFQRR